MSGNILAREFYVKESWLRIFFRGHGSNECYLAEDKWFLQMRLFFFFLVILRTFINSSDCYHYLGTFCLYLVDCFDLAFLLP